MSKIVFVRKFILLVIGVFLWSHALDAVPGSISSPYGVETTVSIMPSFLQEGIHILSWQAWVTLIVLILVFLILVSDKVSSDRVMFSGACALFLFGIVDSEEFLSGFSQDIIFILAFLFVIAETFKVNGIIELITRSLTSKSKNHFKQYTFSLLPFGIASGFLNNTPIVLIMMSVFKKLSLEIGSKPSKYLIPLSYITILGGTCTLIGTSVNIVVDGLLRQHIGEGLGFFEIGKIGLPILVVGFLYCVFIGYYLLPFREDPSSRLRQDTRKFTGEFIVTHQCELIGKNLIEAGKDTFLGQSLIEIERKNEIIAAPNPYMEIRENDRLIFAGDAGNIAKLSSIKGLTTVSSDPHLDFGEVSPRFCEAVISSTSTLIGKSISRANFRSQFGSSIVAVYRQGIRVKQRLRDVILHAGDVLMLLSSKEWFKERVFNNDFYIIRHIETEPSFNFKRNLFIIGVLALVIISVSMGLPMLYPTLSACIVFILSKSISFREAKRAIHWKILLLIASALPIGLAIQKTGLAHLLANIVFPLTSLSNASFIGGIFLITMITTELVTNAAAAMLIYPIAVDLANMSGHQSTNAMKAVAITVAIAASCSFITPIGYQTNTIVYGPGGYLFKDYIKVGLPLSFIVWGMASYLVPIFWPF